MSWRVTDIKARLHKMVVVSPEEMDKYIDEIGENIEFRHPIYTPLGKSLIEKGSYDSIDFDSKWEAAFYIYWKEIKGCVVQRNKEDYIIYMSSEGKERKFYYDFSVNGEKYEVKGRFRPDDFEKQRQCTDVKFICGDDMKEIIKTVNKFKPNWRNEYIAKM